jgi:hypothetical protein
MAGSGQESSVLRVNVTVPVSCCHIPPKSVYCGLGPGTSNAGHPIISTSHPRLRHLAPVDDFAVVLLLFRHSFMTGAHFPRPFTRAFAWSPLCLRRHHRQGLASLSHYKKRAIRYAWRGRAPFFSVPLVLWFLVAPRCNDIPRSDEEPWCSR